MAGVAVGLGVAVAKVGQERSRRRRLRRDRRPGIRREEQLGEALQRMALGQVDYALHRLAANNGHADPRAVHDTRKAIKRLRALVRLLEGHLGPEAARAEDRSLARTARLLGGSRDAEVLLESFDSLVNRNGARLGHRRGVSRARRLLAAESERMQRDGIGDPAVRARTTGELLALRARIGAWQLGRRDQPDLFEPGLVQIYRDGRKRYRRAAAGKASEAADMHAWRRRVKDLRYVTEMLSARDTALRNRDSERLRRTAARASELGEVLGEEHDLVMLAAWLDAAPRKGRKGERIGGGTRRELHRAIRRQRQRLRRRALSEGERLYRRRPRSLAAVARAAVTPR